MGTPRVLADERGWIDDMGSDVLMLNEIDAGAQCKADKAPNWMDRGPKRYLGLDAKHPKPS